MAAELWVNDASVARQIREIWVNDNGVARHLNELWVNDAGTARLIYADGVVSIANTSVTVTGYGTAGYELWSDGRLFTDATGFTSWISPHYSMSRYEVRATQLSKIGSGTFSGTIDNWLPLSTTRSWSANRSSGAGPGSDVWQLTLEIRRASDSVVVDSATITLTSSN